MKTIGKVMVMLGTARRGEVLPPAVVAAAVSEGGAGC
jgi:hypothetical protein